jgi:hypothetical protein
MLKKNESITSLELNNNVIDYSVNALLDLQLFFSFHWMFYLLNVLLCWSHLMALLQNVMNCSRFWAYFSAWQGFAAIAEALTLNKKLRSIHLKWVSYLRNRGACQIAVYGSVLDEISFVITKHQLIGFCIVFQWELWWCPWRFCICQGSGREQASQSE